ncbi:GNAT family N-acetyltransferase [Candidatus Bipolaricaulota bacterium]
MTSELRIEWLADHPEAVETLASWENEEWGHLMPEVSLERLAGAFRKRANRDRIPATLIGYSGDKLVGTASIVRHDMSILKHLSPWLAIVYVDPVHRNHGFGSALVLGAMRTAAGFGMEALYLFTPDQMTFYERLGWQSHEVVEYRGERVTIMACTPPKN